MTMSSPTANNFKPSSNGDSKWGNADQSGRDDIKPGPAEVSDSLVTNMKDTAKMATRAVKEQAFGLASDVGLELKKNAEDQKLRGAQAMQALAHAIDTAATDLEEQSPHAAKYARETAQKISTLSESIGGRSIAELAQTVSDLARSQPVVFFAGAVAAGFALSRFLRSSATNVVESAEATQIDGRKSHAD